MPLYKINRRFYDGQDLHEIDSVLEFEEGTQPSSAVRVEARPTKKKPVEDDDFVEEPPMSIVDAETGATLHSLSKVKK